jgi:hypothetical protein
MLNAAEMTCCLLVFGVLMIQAVEFWMNNLPKFKNSLKPAVLFSMSRLPKNVCLKILAGKNTHEASVITCQQMTKHKFRQITSIKTHCLKV